jgi:hypothetical protein
MSRPKTFRNIDCCEYCKYISWLSRGNAWCLKHEFDLNLFCEHSILKICDDFEENEE